WPKIPADADELVVNNGGTRPSRSHHRMDSNCTSRRSACEVVTWRGRCPKPPCSGAALAVLAGTSNSGAWADPAAVLKARRRGKDRPRNASTSTVSRRGAGSTATDRILVNCTAHVRQGP